MVHFLNRFFIREAAFHFCDVGSGFIPVIFIHMEGKQSIEDVVTARICNKSSFQDDPALVILSGNLVQ